MAEHKIRRALIAVYDKAGIADFARVLVDEFGIEVISTGGTARHLKDAGISVTLVEEVTGFPEMLDGRVKTLHPKIHAAILADRDNPDHMRQLAEQGIQPIDMVVVNLYPFEKTVADPNCKFEDAIEMIDIGGPCLLRAAAKNHRHVLPVPGPDWYAMARYLLRNCGLHGREKRPMFNMVECAFILTAGYDGDVARWLSRDDATGHATFRQVQVLGGSLLRYGENPHQSGDVFQSLGGLWQGVLSTSSLNEDSSSTSYNNYLDADAALRLCSELARAGSSLWHRLLAGAVEASQLLPISEQQITRRNLPHIQRPGATYFVTFRVKNGTLNPEEREIVLKHSLFPDGQTICLHAAVIMPDHVHLLMTPLEHAADTVQQVGKVLQGIKGVSARRINELRKKEGPVWLDENWDRIMRHEKEFRETLDYIIHNPLTAGLPDAEDYAWCVSEVDPGWIKIDRRAGVDLKHKLLRGLSRREEVESPHRLRAGATKEENPLHRLRAGATPFRPSVVIFIKHTNACGVGIADDAAEAYRRAYLGDPNAAMGGILAVNFPVTVDFATTVMETYDRFGKAAGAGGFFVEVWVAPSFDEEAVKIIRTKKKWGENVRLLAVGDMSVAPNADELEYKTIAGGMLVQSRDLVGLNEDKWKVVTNRSPSESEMSDLRLAWLVAKHTKSNAISICRDGMLIGNGAGQMSRVMSCRIATWLAKENGHADKLAGSAAASDAFFPFRDGPEILLDAGVTAIIQPGGSKRDEETIAACDERGAAMIFTGTRHFRH